MSWILLLAATTVVISLVVLAVSLRRVAGEVKRLGHSMRRLRAVAVAKDDLRHFGSELNTRASELNSIEMTRRFRALPDRS